MPLPAPGWPRPLRYLLGAKRLRRLIRDFEAHAVHLQSVGSGALLAWAVPRKLLVITPWGSEIATHSRGLRWWLIRRALERASLILTTSREMAATVKERVRVDDEVVSTISWGVDVSLYRPATRAERDIDRSRFGLPLQATIVSAVRGMSQTYRTLDIADAFAASLPKRRDTHLVLLRGFEPANRRARLAKRRYESLVLDRLEATAPGHYTFVDRVLQPAEMAALIRATDIVVSVPRTDQRAASILEALGTGVTVIGSSIPPYRELLEDGFEMVLLPEPIAPALAAYFSNGGALTERARATNSRLVVERESSEEQLSEIALKIESMHGAG